MSDSRGAIRQNIRSAGSTRSVEHDPALRLLMLLVAVLLVLVLVGFVLLANIRDILQSSLPQWVSQPDAGVVFATAAWVLLILVALMIGIGVVAYKLKRV